MSAAPTVGRTVHYRLDSYNAEVINKRGRTPRETLPEHTQRAEGTQLHIGNGVCAGMVVPMIITRVWGTSSGSLVNGQVILDGTDTYWDTSVIEGDDQRSWFWPPRA